MIATVAGTEYTVRFSHETMPLAEVKHAPSAKELSKAVILASMVINEGLKDSPSVEKSVAAVIMDVARRVLGAQYEVSHITTCYIKDPAGEQVSSGAAACLKPDNFSRATGRLISFLKAVRAFPEGQRQAFYDAYAASKMRMPYMDQMEKLAQFREWEEDLFAFYQRWLAHRLEALPRGLIDFSAGLAESVARRADKASDAA